MIVEMEKSASEEEIEAVITRIKREKFAARLEKGEERTVVCVLGSNTGGTDTSIFEVLPGVKKVIRIMSPFKLASRDFRKKDTVVKIGDVEIGGQEVVIIAGPCAVESKEQVLSCVELARDLGFKILRGGAFKPRSSPFQFQGLGERGLEILAEAREKTGLPVVTEVTSPEKVSLVAKYADALQIGARNMQNYELLKAAGCAGKPILLKNGIGAKVEELLTAADYLLNCDHCQVVLCERGINTFRNSETRFTLDVSAVPVVKRLSHLPVIVDPSHAAGKFYYVPALARAGIAAGADGLIIEIHPDPKSALCDGSQALTFSDFKRLMPELRKTAEAIGREMSFGKRR